MAKKTTKTSKRKVEQYSHKDKNRLNNPPVGLVTPQTDEDKKKKKYSYDPHLDPQLQWAGKAEHTSFEVPTKSLHVHERIDPRTIIEAVKKTNGNGVQQSLFSLMEENPPLREAVEFYKHKHNWANRMIAGDSLLVMNSLLEKEGMSGKVQMIYMDPPYGIKYGSNFQPFVNKRDVKDGKDEDLTSEPEMIKAFRDTWELGIHSYLTYMRDRLLLAKKLLNESGSIFVQISNENMHYIRCLMDEIFGEANFAGQIVFQTTSGFETGKLSRIGDYLLWYAKDLTNMKYRQLFESQNLQPGEKGYIWLLFPDGSQRSMSQQEKNNTTLIPENAIIYKAGNIKSQGASNTNQEFVYKQKTYHPGKAHHWKTTVKGLEKLAELNRIHLAKNSIQYRRFITDFPYMKKTDVWNDTGTGSFLEEKIFVVQTSTKVIERCILMTTDPGDLVIDPTCGSGTTADVAEQWGRRWITCDTSRVAITLAKQRLMTVLFDYYKLAHADEGVGSGFVYKTVPHVTLKSIANNEPPAQETLYDQPFMDNSKARVTGPFTVEAVPSPTAKNLETKNQEKASEISAGRSEETTRQAEWRDELLNNGVRGKGKQYIQFSRVEPMSGTRYIQAEAETIPAKEKDAERVFVVFGPEHAPIEQRQVALALDEAQSIRPKAKIILFAAFQFDPEAAKDIDETNWPGVNLLRVQMNADLFTYDLKKKRSSDDSFWLLGQPDVQVKQIKSGEDKGKFRVEVKGFDYYDTVTGNVISGSDKNIAIWMLDTDYDGRSLFPRHVFFPMASETEGWGKLAKNLKAEIDSELIEAYRGSVSLPFAAGEYKQIAVKIVDDRGIESLRIIKI